jgi:hypothetical protein
MLEVANVEHALFGMLSQSYSLRRFPAIDLSFGPSCSSSGGVDVNRWDEKAGLRRDAVRSQVIDALEAQEIKGDRQ